MRLTSLFPLSSLALLLTVFATGCMHDANPAVKVESIAIIQGDLTLTEGESTTLTAEVLPKNATDKTVSWRTSDAGVVMVSGSGKIAALSVGSAVITAQSGEKTDFIMVTVVAKTIPVSGVSLDKQYITITVGDNEQLEATVIPADASNNNLNWISSDTEVATVENGRVTGVNPGTATITAKTEDGEKVSTCTVTVVAKVAPTETVGADNISAVSAVLLGKANISSTVPSNLEVGFHYSISQGILPSNSVKVQATDADAEYNYTCGITGLEVGTTYYYRSYISQNGQDTYGETKSFTTKDLASLLTTLDATEVGPKSATLNAVLELNDVQYATLEYGFFWGTSESSQDTKQSCESIERGVFTSSLQTLSPETQYWYKCYVMLDGRTFCGEVKTFTTDVVPVASVSLDKTEYTFHTIGSTISLKATVLPEDATSKAVTWTTSAPEVATVTANGEVTAVGNGRATIAVKSDDEGKTATCDIWVEQYVTGIRLRETTLCLNEGEEASLTTEVSPDNANDKTLAWRSSDESVVSVDFLGNVKGVRQGIAVITASAMDGSGVSASCTVTVLFPVPEVVDLGLSVKWADSNIGASKPEDYGAYYAWGETESKGVYNYSTYKWCNGSGNTLTKYNTKASYGFVDNRTELEPEDDVAHVKLGSSWRMPTRAEMDELRSLCSWSWTRQNGILGYIVTGPSGNSIFLPAAGSYGGSSVSYVGSEGSCWSSTLYADTPNLAYDFIFYPGNINENGYYRYVGLSVRAVYGAPAVHPESVTINKYSLSLPAGCSEQLTVSVYPANASIKTVTWSSSNTSVATISSDGLVMANAVGSAIITVTTIDGGVTANCEVTVTPLEPDAVDLGLSVKWANCNVGAASLQDYGDYFAWGETKPKNDYSWSNYKFRTSGSTYSDLQFSKYNSLSQFGTVDNKTVLDLEDDAANASWGGKWRMPTYDEFRELADNCTWEWTTLNGVFGRKITSNKPGYTDKWIFLPAGGRWDGASIVKAGTRGFYWSSSIIVGMSDKAYYQFLGPDESYITVFERDFGFSVRPVCK